MTTSPAVHPPRPAGVGFVEPAERWTTSFPALEVESSKVFAR